MLRRWWVKKYQKPWNSKEFQDATREELLVEFYEDFFEEHPNEKLEAMKDENGNIIYSTDDDLFDKWQMEESMGFTPDFDEGRSKESIRKENEAFRRANGEEPSSNEEVIEDAYDPNNMDYRAQMLRKLKKTGMPNFLGSGN